MSKAFLTLYYGETVASSKLIALSADPKVVREFAARLLDKDEQEQDAVLRELEGGRRRALQVVRSE